MDYCDFILVLYNWRAFSHEKRAVQKDDYPKRDVCLHVIDGYSLTNKNKTSNKASQKAVINIVNSGLKIVMRC